MATTRCFFELVRRKYFAEELTQFNSDFFDQFLLKNTELIQPIEFEHRNLKEASKALRQEISTQAAAVKIPHSESDLAGLADQPFVHCHAHSQFSILQSTASTQDLIRAAAEDGMPGIALTDMGNMMGAFHFLQQIEQYNKSIAQEGKENTKGIVGCELNVCEDHSNKRQKDNGYQIVFLAKNKTIPQFSQIILDGLYPRVLLCAQGGSKTY